MTVGGAGRLVDGGGRGVAGGGGVGPGGVGGDLGVHSLVGGMFESMTTLK